MSSTLWAPYGDAIKLILTGSTSQSLSADQKTIYLTMLDQGMVDKRGNKKKKRKLKGVRTRKYVTNAKTGEWDTYYYIPDLFNFMLTQFKEWSIFNPPVDLDFLNSLVNESGKPIFMFSNAPGHKSWEESEQGKYHWNLICKKLETEREIAELQKTNHGNDPLKLEAQRRLSDSLKTKLNEVNQQLRKIEKIFEKNQSASLPIPSGYIAYPKALSMLASRLNATPEEIAAWVWLRTKNGGLTAYKGIGTDAPQEFYYDYLQGENYLAPLMGCWFLESKINQFSPSERFITGKCLIERWSNHSGLDVVAFIEAKVDEGRLSDHHPTMGGTRASNPGDETYPPIESGLYSLTEILEIEKTDFYIENEISEVVNSTPETGSPEWRQELGRKAANARHNKPGGSRDKKQKIREIWASGKYSSRNICAEEECAALGITYSTAREALKNTPDPKS